MTKKRRPEIAGVGERIFGSVEDQAASNLLPQVASVYLEDIPCDIIDPNPYQPRDGAAHDEALDELAASIRERGILQPIRLRPRGERYELVAGERRWRAAQLVGLGAVPAIVVDIDDAAMRVEAIIENVQREDLNDIERANALRELKESLGLTWDAVAERVGLTRRSVMRIVGLTELPEPVQALIADGKLSEKHGRALRRLKDEPDKQLEMAEAAVSEGLSGDETAALVKTTIARDRDSVDPATRATQQASLVIEKSSQDLAGVFTSLVDTSLARADQQQLKRALEGLDETLRALRALLAG